MRIGLVGFRDFDLRTLLSEIGKERDPDDLAFATSHLQHALQNYIVGHFLCSLKIRSEVPDREVSHSVDIDHWTVTEVLANSSGARPGDGSQKEFLQAFSLAALFHDVGLLMFPRMFFQPEKLIQNDDQLKERLKKLEGKIGESAKELVEHCENELHDAKYFDPKKESSLSSALSRLKEEGIADHSVLGAWYLHRSVQNLNDTDFESVVKPAVRVVLLHQIHEIREQSVNTAEDPVAGLLILCDQVFECLPGTRTRVNGNHWVNRSPDGFRSSAIRLPELAMHTGDKDEMICELVLNDNSFTDGWPSIEIELVHPDYKLFQN